MRVIQDPGTIEWDIWSVNPGLDRAFYGIELTEWVSSPIDYILLDMFLDIGAGDHEIHRGHTAFKVPDNWIVA